MKQTSKFVLALVLSSWPWSLAAFASESVEPFEVHVRSGPVGDIRSVEMSTDGTFLAIQEEVNLQAPLHRVRIWDLLANREVGVLDLPFAAFVKFLPDSHVLVYRDNDRGFVYFDADDFRETKTVKVDGGGHYLFSGDGKTWVRMHEGRVDRFDMLSSTAAQRKLQMDSWSPLAVSAVNHNGSAVAIAGTYDASQEVIVCRESRSPVSLSKAEDARVFDQATRGPLGVLGGVGRQELLFHPSQPWLLDVRHAPLYSARVWDTESGSLLREYARHRSGEEFVQLFISSDEFARTPNSEYVAITVSYIETTFPDNSYELTQKEQVIVWNTNGNWMDLRGELERAVKLDIPSVRSAAVTADGQYVAAVCGDPRRIELWSVARKQKIRDLGERSSRVVRVVPNADFSRFATQDESGRFSVWDLRNGRRRADDVSTGVLTHGSTLGRSYSIIQDSPAGISLFDLEKQLSPVKIDFDSSPKKSATYSSEAKRSSDALWESFGLTDVMAKLTESQPDKSLDAWLSGDGSKLAVRRGRPEALEIYSLPDGVLLTRHEPEQLNFIAAMNSTGSIYAFSNTQPTGDDSRSLASVVQVYRLHKEKPFAVISVSTEPDVLEISPDGDLIAIGDGANERVIVYSTKTQQPLWEARADVPFSPAVFAFMELSARRGDAEAKRIVEDEEIRRRVYENSWGNIRGMEFAPVSGDLMIGSDDGNIRRWSQEGSLLEELEGAWGAVSGLRVSENGEKTLAWYADGRVCLWESGRDIPLASFYQYDREDFLITMEDRYYKGSRQGLRAFSFSIDDQPVPLPLLDLERNRPEYILEQLGFASSFRVQNHRKAAQLRQTWVGNALKLMEGSTIKIDRTNLEPQSELIQIRLPFTASVPAGYEARVIVRVNGVVDDAAGSNSTIIGGSTSFVEVALTEGLNRIDLSLETADATEIAQDDVLIDCLSATPGKTHILTIGVAQYEPEASDLKYPGSDAERIARLLMSTQRDIGIAKTIRNARANKEAIVACLNELAQSKREDLVVVFYSGHGFRDQSGQYVMGASGIDRKNIESTGISYTELDSLMRLVPARKKVLLLDSCESGAREGGQIAMAIADEGYTGSKGDGSRPPLRSWDPVVLAEDLFVDLLPESGISVLAAGRSSAQELDKFGSGAFTYFLEKGCREYLADQNGDRRITVSELADYIGLHVKEETNGLQEVVVRKKNPYVDAVLYP